MVEFVIKVQKPYFCPLLDPFCPFLAKKKFLSKKRLHHKKYMVFYHHAKKYKKRSNGSKDIAIWEIERSDWSRAFVPVSREQEFFRTCGFRRKLANHKTLRFRPFLAKTNGWIFRKIPKTLFCHFLDPFWPFFGQMRIFPKNRALSLLSLYRFPTSCKKNRKN